MGELASQASELSMSFVGRINPTHTPSGFRTRGTDRSVKLQVRYGAPSAPANHF